MKKPKKKQLPTSMALKNRALRKLMKIPKACTSGDNFGPCPTCLQSIDAGKYALKLK